MKKNGLTSIEKEYLPDDGGLKVGQPVYMNQAPVIADGQEEEKCKGSLKAQPQRRQCTSQKMCLKRTNAASFGGKVQKKRLSFNEPMQLIDDEQSRSRHQEDQKNRDSQQKLLIVIDGFF